MALSHFLEIRINMYHFCKILRCWFWLGFGWDVGLPSNYFILKGVVTKKSSLLVILIFIWYYNFLALWKLHDKENYDYN